MSSGLELGQRTGPHNCGDCPPGSGWGDWRVQPAAEAPEEPVEEWKARKVERQHVGGLGVYSEENPIHPFVVYSQGCGRCCSELACQV